MRGACRDATVVEGPEVTDKGVSAEESAEPSPAVRVTPSASLGVDLRYSQPWQVLSLLRRSLVSCLGWEGAIEGWEAFDTSIFLFLALAPVPT